MCLKLESFSNFYFPLAGEDDIEGYETMLAVEEVDEYETMVVGNSATAIELSALPQFYTQATSVEIVAHSPK